MHISLDKNTEYIIKMLEDAGFEAFAVGGCVRDCVLGREVTDYDITTSALPDETKSVFSSESVLETGIRHGTVTVLIDRKPYEVTTYRVEKGYADQRHPDEVMFVRDINEDLARRDFTMNAVAFSPKRGIVDPFFGIEDIKSGTIRAVGDPVKRFSEDSLRILRALRFSATLGFKLEENTSKAVFLLSETLLKVSAERIYTELKRLLTGDDAARVLSEYREALFRVLPLKTDVSMLSQLPKNHAMRLAYVCGEDALKTLENLHADNETKRVAEILLNSSPIPSKRYELKKYISSLGREDSLLVSAYRRAVYGEDPEMETEKMISSGCCLFVKDLAVNGNDLSSIGINGIKVGKALLVLLDLVLKDAIENDQEVLIAKAKDIDI